jgi:6-pyruvoyltetrahydropterin/6-carboxytetrahydropterin synthase
VDNFRFFGGVVADRDITEQSNYVFGVVKNYDHALGLSVCFRQWSDTSHCHFLHGYALRVSLEFVSLELDGRNWVIPFGGLKEIKQYLVDNFDHKTFVAETDPEIETFKTLHQKQIIDLVIVPALSVELFAKMIFERVNDWLEAGRAQYGNAVLRKVAVSEHDANHGYYEDLNWQQKLIAG